MRAHLKESTIFLLLIACLTSQSLKAEDFRFSDQDKQLHIAVAYGATLSTMVILRKQKVSPWKSFLISSLLTMAAGVAKEKFIDQEFSSSDLLANGIGVAGAGLFMVVIRF